MLVDATTHVQSAWPVISPTYLRLMIANLSFAKVVIANYYSA